MRDRIGVEIRLRLCHRLQKVHGNTVHRSRLLEYSIHALRCILIYIPKGTVSPLFLFVSLARLRCHPVKINR